MCSRATLHIHTTHYIYCIQCHVLYFVSVDLWAITERAKPVSCILAVGIREILSFTKWHSKVSCRLDHQLQKLDQINPVRIYVYYSGRRVKYSTVAFASSFVINRQCLQTSYPTIPLYCALHSKHQILHGSRRISRYASVCNILATNLLYLEISVKSTKTFHYEEKKTMILIDWNASIPNLKMITM